MYIHPTNSVSRRRSRIGQKGYSLIEMLTVTLMVSVVLGASIPVLGNIYSAAKLRSSVESLSIQIQLAKMKAINENTSVTLSISTADRTYQLQGGEIQYLDNTVSFNGTPPASLAFDSLGRLISGVTTTVNLIGKHGTTGTITINPSGRITIS